MVVEEALDRLYAAPLDEFVDVRKSLAAELRSGGDKDGAKEVASARKPTVPAAALNRAVRGEPDLLKGVLDAQASLRAAQERLDREGIRKCSAAEREAVDALVAVAVREAPASAAEAMRGTLHAAALSEDVRSALRAGRLLKPAQASGLGLEGGFVPSAPSKPSRSSKETRKGESKGARKAAPPKPSRTEARARREAEARVRALEEAVARAERALDRARLARERAEEAERDAAAEVDRRRSELESAR